MPSYWYPSTPATYPGYTRSTNPRQIATSQGQNVSSQGNQLMQQEANYLNEYTGAGTPNNVTSTADYLNTLENPLAEGKGGYTPQEQAQIQMTPQQQQDIVNAAGASAGANTEAAVQAAQRAANAAGGNPMAMAAYRQRMGMQAGSEAANAETAARVGASNAAAEREENIGQTRIGQQNQGLNYYQGQNAQAQQTANQANALMPSIYATETGGTGQASQLGLMASQTPSTLDKLIGAGAGALSSLGSFLDEGDVSTGQKEAVIGEHGPEKVIDLKKDNGGRYSYLDDGGYGDMGNYDAPSDAPAPPSTTTPSTANPSATGTSTPQIARPWWQRLGQGMKSNTQPPGSPQQRFSMTSSMNQPWSPVTPYSQVGSAVGNVLGGLLNKYLDDGDVVPLSHGMKQGDNGIFTEPTRVTLEPGEAVVPLGYREHAKIRPAMAALPAATVRRPYRGAA
jgi:hypothetical protein